MNNLAKEIQKKYIEEITQKYPLHKFLIIFFYLIAVYVYTIDKDARLLQKLFSIKMNYVFDFKKGILDTITVGHFLFCIICSIFINFFYQVYIALVFKALLCAKKKIDDYVDKLEQKMEKFGESSKEVKLKLIEENSTELNQKKKKLISYHGRIEILLTLASILIFGLKNLILADWIVLATIFIFILLNTYLTIRFYIAEFLPYHVVKSFLEGKKVSFGEEI